MNPIVIVVIVVLVVVVLIVAIFTRRKVGHLRSEGKIVKRSYGFERDAEIFTLSDSDFAKVVETLKDTDLSETGASWESSGQEQVVRFQAYGWKAELSRLKNDGDLFRYQFQFTYWETHNGVMKSPLPMNAMMTSIEKMFLQLDPNTKVETVRQKVSSKPKFF